MFIVALLRGSRKRETWKLEVQFKKFGESKDFKITKQKDHRMMCNSRM